MLFLSGLRLAVPQQPSLRLGSFRLWKPQCGVPSVTVYGIVAVGLPVVAALTAGNRGERTRASCEPFGTRHLLAPHPRIELVSRS